MEFGDLASALAALGEAKVGGPAYVALEVGERHAQFTLLSENKGCVCQFFRAGLLAAKAHTNRLDLLLLFTNAWVVHGRSLLEASIAFPELAPTPGGLAQDRGETSLHLWSELARGNQSTMSPVILLIRDETRLHVFLPVLSMSRLSLVRRFEEYPHSPSFWVRPAPAGEFQLFAGKDNSLGVGPAEWAVAAMTSRL